MGCNYYAVVTPSIAEKINLADYEKDSILLALGTSMAATSVARTASMKNPFGHKITSEDVKSSVSWGSMPDGLRLMNDKVVFHICKSSIDWRLAMAAKYFKTWEEMKAAIKTTVIYDEYGETIPVEEIVSKAEKRMGNITESESYYVDTKYNLLRHPKCDYHPELPIDYINGDFC